MAESSLHDVALKSQSVGDDSPSDALATTTNNRAIEGDAEEDVTAKENGVFPQDHSLLKLDDQTVEDGAVRSDTDTSRANSVTGDNKSSSIQPVKKFTVSKPTSFAKYSVPKTIAANAPAKAAADKAPTPTASSTSSTPLGRPRLVAKTTSSSQQKLSSYKPAAPDPMQVWNKNRAIPQPSTKHLTDEELKQQYGIHLTSRLQSDNEGKEAKWADIDDDEDDWAPETIEWNDGTKTTVTATDGISSKPSPSGSKTLSDPNKSASSSKLAGPSYSSSVGPNATVLKVGASAERQQAQRAIAQQSKGPTERPPSLATQASPAPAPTKSPWAKLPEIDKVSPVAINPQPVTLPPGRFPPGGIPTPVSAEAVPSPAKEISADDFNRAWRDSPSSQTKELFMPNSGRYEAVPDGKRRMSKNEQNFRAPAVLQRPGQRDTRAPAEPSPAFQTHRTSVDQGRRRASSSISGGSGQLARRMSFKSADTINLSQPDTASQRPVSRDQPSPQLQPPTPYQARGPDNVSGAPEGPTDADLEAQRAVQKALMREKIEKARQRKLEEEAKLEAEKQERIRLKLLSLGPPPEPAKPKQEESVPENPAEAVNPAQYAATVTVPVQSPPKPPQPHQTGEPQQYGMMKVHPLDSVKKFSPPTGHLGEAPKPASELPKPSQSPATDKPKLPSPAINGIRPTTESSRPVAEDVPIPEPSPKFSKAIGSLAGEARSGWGGTRNDHRPAQTGSLWGLPNNKALGNGTFDQSLAGYSPQDLSRTSSTGQGWMNGRTPTVGQSPQATHVTQHVPETRSHLLQSMTSPDSQPQSTSSGGRLAPIGRPQAPAAPSSAQNNGNSFPARSSADNLAAWSSFEKVARAQETAETERFTREFNERREEEERTGIRQQAPYNFRETFKQVQIGDQVGQRHISNVAQTTHGPNSMFGAVGSVPTGEAPARASNGQYGQVGRGSRFFPQQPQQSFPQDRRAVTYSHPEVPRTPSPPPAEDLASFHPAFDGNFQRPKVHFPREKAVVRLPPAAPPAAAPPAKEPTPPPPPTTQAKTPLTWAARLSMPAPAPTPVRAVSTPLVNNPSWQERFNGLLFPKQASTARGQPAPALTSSREPLDIITPGLTAASVSLPHSFGEELNFEDAGKVSSKDVEDEEDLFEDREAGSLPTIHFPREVLPLMYPRATLPRLLPAPVDSNSIHMFMVSNWSERYGFAKPQYAVVKAPGGSGKGIKRDLPTRNVNASAPPRPRNNFATKHSMRPKPGSKPRVASQPH